MSTAATTSSSSLANSQGRKIAIGVAIAVGIVLLILLFRWLFTGVTGEELHTTYGKRRGYKAADSVSGTGVLAGMFQDSGHKVTTWSRLSPGLKEKADVIVWVPDDFAPPTREQRQFLEEWLNDGSGRTLVYVGRDYDAATSYWKTVLPQTTPEQKSEFERARAQAQVEYVTRRSQMPKSQYARWFTAKRDGQMRNVRLLAGPWAAGVDGTKVEIQVEGRLQPPQEADRTPAIDPAVPEDVEPLLWSSPFGRALKDEDVIVSRVTDPAMGDGQVIVIANGSFVLNYPLVNHEHRKLAGKLIEECGDGKKVVFLESGAGGPEVLSKEPVTEDASGLEILQVWPLNAIIWHLTILGIIFCIARSPIFGRPKELPTESQADFGKHITALGRLMGRGKDRAYADARLTQYQMQAKRKSGKSHLKGA